MDWYVSLEASQKTCYVIGPSLASAHTRVGRLEPGTVCTCRSTMKIKLLKDKYGPKETAMDGTWGSPIPIKREKRKTTVIEYMY
jgi:hypothetical protein